jgi:hypothetical protein
LCACSAADPAAFSGQSHARTEQSSKSRIIGYLASDPSVLTP